MCVICEDVDVNVAGEMPERGTEEDEDEDEDDDDWEEGGGVWREDGVEEEDVDEVGLSE